MGSRAFRELAKEHQLAIVTYGAKMPTLLRFLTMSATTGLSRPPMQDALPPRQSPHSRQSMKSRRHCRKGQWDNVRN
jgi:hypothetical protein